MHLLARSESFLVPTHPWKKSLAASSFVPVAISQPDRPNSEFGLSFVIVAFAESSRTLIHMHHTDFGPIRSQPRVWQRWALVPAPKYCTKTKTECCKSAEVGLAH